MEQTQVGWAIPGWTAPPDVDLEAIDRKAREFKSGEGDFIHDIFLELKLDVWYHTTKTIAVQCLIERETLQGVPLDAAMVFLGAGLFRKQRPIWLDRDSLLSLLQEEQLGLWFIAFYICARNFNGRYSASRKRTIQFHEYLATALPIHFGVLLRHNVMREIPLARLPVEVIPNEEPARNSSAWSYPDLAKAMGITSQAAKQLFAPGSILRNKVKYAKIYGIEYLAADLD